MEARREIFQWQKIVVFRLDQNPFFTPQNEAKSIPDLSTWESSPVSSTSVKNTLNGNITNSLQKKNIIGPSK